MPLVLLITYFCLDETSETVAFIVWNILNCLLTGELIRPWALNKDRVRLHQFIEQQLTQQEVPLFTNHRSTESDLSVTLKAKWQCVDYITQWAYFSLIITERSLCADRCAAEVYLKRWDVDDLSIHSPRSEEQPSLKNNIHKVILYYTVGGFIWQGSTWQKTLLQSF